MQQRSPCPPGGARLPLLIAVCFALISCRQPDAAGNSADAQPANGQHGATDMPRVPLAAHPMGRADLLSAVAQAASVAASGANDREAQRDLNGSIFELRIRFGCSGPTKTLGDDAFGWDLDRAKRRLRVRAMPTISLEDELVAQLAAGKFEAVEGFWLPRPWMLDAVCPAAPTLKQRLDEVEQKTPARAPTSDEKEQPRTAAAAQPAWPRIGIAQFFTSTESRTQRRSARAYEAARTIEPDQPLGSEGFDLVLSGRLKALPDGKVIACSNSPRDTPPECIISGDFDRVWIELPKGNEVLAEWRSG